MQQRINRRGYEEHYVEHQHLKLNDLKREAWDIGLQNNYLYNDNIPKNPKPEFHVFHLKHETSGYGLRGIREDEGFRHTYADGVPLVWWSLAVKPDNIKSAERRLLEKTFPDRTEEQASIQQSFLFKFTTSPAFKETSRLGSYRFTFPLEEVLTAYSNQFCSGARPVMRVYETVLHKMEVVYSVLVHSPDNQNFSRYPLLTDDLNTICNYRDGHFIWRPESMNGEHSYKLILREDRKQMEAYSIHWVPRYYVWDNIAIAFYMENEQVLKFEVDQLRKNLEYCEQGPGGYAQHRYETLDKAQREVRDLWPDMDIPLSTSGHRSRVHRAASSATQ